MIALIVAVVVVVPLGVWHFLGYFNGRYARWASESDR